MNTPLKVRITPAVAADYVARGMAESYEGLSNPYKKIDGPGTYTFTHEEAAELRQDAIFYVEPCGPGQALSFGERQAYHALVRQIYAKQLAAVKGQALLSDYDAFRDELHGEATDEAIIRFEDEWEDVYEQMDGWL